MRDMGLEGHQYNVQWGMGSRTVENIRVIWETRTMVSMATVDMVGNVRRL